MSITTRALLVLLLLALGSAARSDGINNPIAANVTGIDGINNPLGSGVGPTCSNSLDFSQACNSQYIGLL